MGAFLMDDALEIDVIIYFGGVQTVQSLSAYIIERSQHTRRGKHFVSFDCPISYKYFLKTFKENFYNNGQRIRGEGGREEERGFA